MEIITSPLAFSIAIVLAVNKPLGASMSLTGYVSTMGTVLSVLCESTTITSKYSGCACRIFWLKIESNASWM